MLKHFLHLFLCRKPFRVAINKGRAALETKVKSLPWTTVFVNDLEPPRFAIITNDTAVKSMFIYDNATTGDKYSVRDMKFVLVDNDPNSDVSAASMKLFFPLSDINEKAQLDGSVRKVRTNLREEYTLKNAGGGVKDEGKKAFGFTLTGDSEMWGAPYMTFTQVLPVVESGAVTASALRNKSLKSTPFMFPDHVGRLKYDVEFNSGIGGSASKLQYKEIANLLMFFEVKDNDPPNVIIRARTSFTEIDEFAVAVTDVDDYNFGDFDIPSIYLNKFKTALSGDEPSSWPGGIVDSMNLPTANSFGQSICKIMGISTSTKVPSDTTGDAKVIDVKKIADGGTPDWDNGYIIYIPEGSRTVFSVQAYDNISDGSFQMSLKAGDNLR